MNLIINERNEKMKFAPFLKEHGTIGFAAPSFGCAIEPYRTAFDHAVSRFEKMGYTVKKGPNVYASDGIGISSTPEKCAREFMELYLDKDVDAILSCGGGELMCEIVPFVDFERLKEADPKWFMGYSDNTNLTFLLATLSDTASVYGPCAPAFGMEPWHPALLDAFGVLTGEKDHIHNYPAWEKESKKDEDHPLEPYNVTEPFHPVIRNQGKETVELSGRLLGGCLDCLNNLCGTPYDKVAEFQKRYGSEGVLWFLESCDLNVMDMRRSLWRLREAGWFEQTSGFLIGRPMHFDEPMMGLDQYEAVMGILSELHVPVILDLDIGHTAPMMPLVCGARAQVRAGEGHFEISYQNGD